MPSIYDIRADNLRRLVQQTGPRERFAVEMGWSVSLLAQYLSRGKARKTIGFEQARHIESKFGKPENWLDGINLSDTAYAVALKVDKLSIKGRESLDQMADALLENTDPPPPVPMPAAPENKKATESREKRRRSRS